MKASKIIKAVCAIGIVSACAFALPACTNSDDQNPNKIEGLTGGVAATVNGAEVKEDTVTTYIQQYRTSQGMEEEDVWGQWLADYDYTPEQVREEIVNFYINQELIKQAAKEKNVEVPDTEIDEYVDQMKSYYESDEKWQEALESAGFTEDEYREEVRISLLEGKVQDAVAPSEGATDEEVIEYVMSTYNGAKKSSHILFAAEDEATAADVLARINAGELDFAEAAKEYSTDGSASTGGDVGWDKLSSFVQEYTDALALLEKDQVSGLVTSEYGIHIIKCTDVFTLPEGTTDISLIPEDFLQPAKSTIEATNKSEAYENWYAEYKESADIVINEMPEKVPYNVDVSKYKSASEDGSEGDAITPDGATTDEGTATDEQNPVTEDQAAGEATTDQPAENS